MTRLMNSVAGLDLYEKLALGFGVCLLVALLVLSSFHKIGGYGVETDFYWAYAPDAERISNGETPNEPGVGPGYALALILVNFFTGDWFAGGKVLSILSTVFAGLLMAKTVSRLFDSKVGLYTLLIWSATVLPWTIVAGTDMFFAFVVTAAIFFLFRSERPSNLDIALSAALMGYAILTRNNAIVLPGAALLMLVFLCPQEWSWGERLQKGAIFTGVCLAVLAPWFLLKSFVFEKQVANDGYLVVASHFYGRAGVVSSEDMRLAAKQFDSLSSVVFYDFPRFVKHYVGNLYRHSYAFLLHSLKFPTFLFVVAGVMVLLPRITKRQASFFLFPIVSFLLLCLVHYEPRYYLYLVGFPISIAVYFLCRPVEIIGFKGVRKKVAHYVSYAALALTVFFLGVFSAKEIRANINSEPRELLQIRDELRTIVKESASIIARKPHLGFLANLETVYFPEATSLDQLLDFAAEQEAEYLLYGDIEADRRPELAILLQPDQVKSDLKLVYIHESPRTVVYRIRKQSDLIERLN